MKRVLFFFVALCMWSTVCPASQVHTNPNDIEATEIVFPGNEHLGTGTFVSGAGDFDGDGFQDFLIGSPSFDAGRINQMNGTGAIFLVLGKIFEQKTTEIDLSSSDVPVHTILGVSEHPIGWSFASPGDLDADGFSDIAIATQTGDAGYLIYGREDIPAVISLAKESERTVRILHTGSRVSPSGDFNGDGFVDVLFGNPVSEHVESGLSQYSIGAYTVIFGTDSLPNEIDVFIPNRTHFRDRGNADARLGEWVSGNFDLDADGFSDIAVLAPKDGKKHTGRGYIIYGNERGFRDNRADYSFIIENANQSIQALGDTDGDGFPELSVGVDENRVLVIKGGKHLHGTLDLKANLDDNWGTMIYGANTVYPAGDLNGDGFADLAVAVPSAQVGEKLLAGQVWLIFGKAQLPKTIDLSKLADGATLPIDYILIDGLHAFDAFGTSVAAVGDIQGDGFDDILIGAPSVRLPEDTMNNRSGSAYLISGVNLYYSLQTFRSTFTQEPSNFKQ